MARYATATDIINRVAVEVGLLPDTDPVGTTDTTYVQLTGLLNAAGQELVEMNAWQALRAVYQFTTADGDTGVYDLPSDFSYMIDQTGWDLSNTVPIGGPLSPQVWSYLLGRDLVSQTIYASFRLVDGTFNLFPQPPPTGIDVRFEYISRNWVLEAGVAGTRKDLVSVGSDTVLYEPIMIIKFLKVKWLDAKGFDSTAARMDFDSMYSGRVGRDTGAPILNAGAGVRWPPYLNAWYNVPDSGYGGV
jgi:hypothetical protein